MKKVFALVIALSLICAMAVTSSAAVPLDDFAITRVSTVPTIDGSFDAAEGWGSPIIEVTGQEMYDYATSSADKRYLPWAVMEENYVNRTDGSVEAMQGITMKVYAKWDDTNLYLCYVVEGLPKFYPNTVGVWYGNSIQLTLGQDDRQANWTDKANDPDKDGIYDGGYVGNEYTIAIATGKTRSTVTQGKFGSSSASLRGASITAVDHTNFQVYEMALPFDKVGIVPDSNKKIPFATALNINIGPDVIERSPEPDKPYPNYNGFQIGKGIFDQMKEDIWDSLNLVLTGEKGSVGSATDTQTPSGDNNNPSGGNNSTDGTYSDSNNSSGTSNPGSSNGSSNGSSSKPNTDSADTLDAVFCGLAAVAALGALVVIKKK